jgi:hypothetical protein
MRLSLKKFVVTCEFKSGYFAMLNRLTKLSISEEHVIRFNTESGLISREGDEDLK